MAGSFNPSSNFVPGKGLRDLTPEEERGSTTKISQLTPGRYRPECVYKDNDNQRTVLYWNSEVDMGFPVLEKKVAGTEHVDGTGVTVRVCEYIDLK